MKTRIVAKIDLSVVVTFDASSIFTSHAAAKMQTCTVADDPEKQEAFLAELNALILKYDEQIPF